MVYDGPHEWIQQTLTKQTSHVLEHNGLSTARYEMSRDNFTIILRVTAPSAIIEPCIGNSCPP